MKFTRNVKRIDHNTYLDEGGKLSRIQLQKVRLSKKEYKYHTWYYKNKT